ncbi:hypothetical protein [Candidatus Synechococcus spongiarum]|uniref:DUF4878 domain-containing protein n=1 Tax=Candidatus Synechococcus spongiarum TaxID=431041 RepID=A0A171DEE4_9SYNE|nr:hypothetical protein [Candidatus Synechococcus spongiarum]SAY38256.1 FIG01151020: hypothetical protein [Candidatus Synechococcus spongiarum]
MDMILLRDYGTKALLAALAALLTYWLISAIRLIISARGINPLVKQFFSQVARGRVDAAYLLTTKNYRLHVSRQNFIRLLSSLELRRYRNLKSGRPRIQEGQIILTVKLNSEDKKQVLPLDFTFVKVGEDWRIDRILKA